MRPKIISLTCLLMVATMMAAQSIKQHEYWIDSDYSSHQTMGSGNTISITVSTAELSSGIHFLNHRALDTDDNWGILNRMLFYVPERAAGQAKVEYWIDNDYANVVKKESSDVNQAFSIDISQLSTGVHFFNFRTIDSNGKYGQLSRSVFYIPAIETETYIAEYKYWIDDAEPTVQEVNKVQSVFQLALDVSGLSDGEHTFSFQAKDINGNWGDLFTKTFLIGEEVDDNIISFVCPVAESICVNNWDTDGDGKLSKTEAAAVQSLGEVFKESEITSFDELQYFTGLTKIDDEAFDNCTKLASVKLPATVTEIGRRAFSHCIFSEIEFPLGLTYIDTEAFYLCESLKSIRIPSSVENMSVVAFVSCTAVESIEVEEGNEAFDSREGCNAIIRKSDKALIRGCKNTIIPAGVERINFAAFQWTPLEGAFVIPEGVTYIDRSAFVSTTMSSVSFPSTLTYIGGWSFQDCDNIESIDIPDGVTSIGDYAFSFCDNLKSVSIPKSVTEIGEKAFIGDTKLESVTSYILQPFAISKNVFISEDMDDGVEEFIDATLYVPYGTKSIYETTDGWKEFKNIIEMGGPESIKISSAKQVTYMSDKDLDFTGYPDLKAYVATGYDKSSGTIWLTRVKEVPANTGFLLMGEADTYEIPVKTGGSNSYYQNMFKGTIEGTTIQTTEGANTNYYLSNGDAGVGFYKVQGSVELKPNRAYLSVPTEIPAVGAAGSTETIKVSAAGQVPYYNSQSLDFSSLDAQGVKAYTATGYDYTSGTIWLTRVKQVPAETGILIMAPQGEYPVPTASVASVYANMFKGTLTGTIIQTHETIADEDYINYYLSSGDAGVGFYKVTKEGGVTIGANRCYLPIKNKEAAGTRSAGSEKSQIAFEEADEVIGIQLMRGIGDDNDGTTNLTPALSKGEGEWYTLQGQRVAKPGKGLYIRNGRKVVIK